MLEGTAARAIQRRRRPSVNSPARGMLYVSTATSRCGRMCGCGCFGPFLIAVAVLLLWVAVALDADGGDAVMSVTGGDDGGSSGGASARANFMCGAVFHTRKA